MKQVILTGEVKAMEPNDKGGLTIKVRNVHGDGKGSNLEFFDVYGNYATTLKEKSVIAVGDVVSVIYEEKKVQKLDESGKPDKWATHKEGIAFKRTYRPSQSEKTHVSSAADNGLDPDTF